MMPIKPEKEIDDLSPCSGKSGLFWDMKIILVWTALSIISIYSPIINESFIRLILSVPLILFIPGYVLLAALFPDSADIDTSERVVFSIGSSIVVTPLIGLCLNFTPWGIRLDPLILCLTAFIIVLVFVAGIRRNKVSSESRYSLPVTKIHHTLSDQWDLRNGSKKERILFFGSILVIGMVIASTILVISLPKPGEKFSEFFILGANRTADSYPDIIAPNITYPIFIGVGNHEYRTVNYTVEVYLTSSPQVNEVNGTETSPEMLPVNIYTVTLNHNETSIKSINFSVPDSRYSHVDFLLFKEIVPTRDNLGPERINASYRHLRLWLNMTSPSESNSIASLRQSP